MREKGGNRRRQQNEDSKVHIHYVTKKKGPYTLYLQIFLNCQCGIEIRFEFDCKKKNLNLAQKKKI